MATDQNLYPQHVRLPKFWPFQGIMRNKQVCLLLKPDKCDETAEYSG